MLKTESVVLLDGNAGEMSLTFTIYASHNARTGRLCICSLTDHLSVVVCSYFMIASVSDKTTIMLKLS